MGEIVNEIPIETLENIRIFSKAQMTTQCAVECMKRGIPVSYYSMTGKYYGKLSPADFVYVERQRKQVKLYDTEFSVGLAKNILKAKIKNQETLMRRYSRNRKVCVDEEIRMLDIFYRKMDDCRTVNQLIGYEGIAARYYFTGLGKLINEEFFFSGRSKHPATDPFNAMLNLGYAIIRNEILGIIEMKGLNPYFGFIHRDKENHPALASDLMEEWRPVIVDSVVMNLLSRHELAISHFEKDTEGHSVILTKEGMKIFINKIEAKRKTKMKYLEGYQCDMDFQRAMEVQVTMLARAIDKEDFSMYKPLHIR